MLIFNKKIHGLGLFVIFLTVAAGSAASAINKMTNVKSEVTKNDNTSSNSSTNSQDAALTKLYDNRDSKYSIKYPSEWIFDNSEKGAIVFSGKKDTPAYYSTVNIQTVLTKKSGGEYSSIADLIADVKSQVLKESPKTNFIDSGPYVLIMQNGFKLNGQTLTFIYSYQGHIIQQWQIVVPRKDKLVFYTWSYTAPIEQYSDDLPKAKAMLATWSIY